MPKRRTLLVVLWMAGCAGGEPGPDEPLDPSAERPGAGERDAGRASDARALSPTPKLDASSRERDSAAGNEAARATSDARTASDLLAAGGGDARVDGGPDAGSPGATSAGCGVDAFCADFEDQTGATLGGKWSAVSPNCTGDGKASIDDRIAHGGERSVRLSSPGGTCHHIFAKPQLDLAPYARDLWVRMYARFEKSLGAEHVTFFAMHDRVTGKDLRMGGQSGILMWNRELGDATLPELSPSGIAKSVPIEAGVWKCIEFHLAGSAGKLETFVDGELVQALVVDGAPTMDIDGQWLRGAGGGSWSASVEDLRFGWESYGGAPNTVWYDDIAVSAARVGCQ